MTTDLIARIAALTAIPEDVEGLCKKLDYYGEPVRRLENGHAAIKQAMREAAATLRAYAARDAKLRREVEAEIKTGSQGVGFNDGLRWVRALIDQQEGE